MEICELFNGNCASAILEICELFNGNCANTILEIIELFNGNCASTILDICDLFNGNCAKATWEMSELLIGNYAGVAFDNCLFDYKSVWTFSKFIGFYCFSWNYKKNLIKKINGGNYNNHEKTKAIRQKKWHMIKKEIREEGDK